MRQSKRCSLIFVPALLALSVASPVLMAAPQHLNLSAGNTQSTMHAKSLVSNVDGSFGKVSGSLSYDLSDQSCHVDMTMAVDSLQVDSSIMRKLMLSGSLLDAEHYPTMHFVGDCAPQVINGKVAGRLVGKLTMRGQTHPVTFTADMVFERNTLVKIKSVAHFDQRQWGVSTMLHTVDPMVESSSTITLDNSSHG